MNYNLIEYKLDEVLKNTDGSAEFAGMADIINSCQEQLVSAEKRQIEIQDDILEIKDRLDKLCDAVYEMRDILRVSNLPEKFEQQKSRNFIGKQPLDKTEN